MRGLGSPSRPRPHGLRPAPLPTGARSRWGPRPPLGPRPHPTRPRAPPHRPQAPPPVAPAPPRQAPGPAPTRPQAPGPLRFTALRTRLSSGLRLGSLVDERMPVPQLLASVFLAEGQGERQSEALQERAPRPGASGATCPSPHPEPHPGHGLVLTPRGRGAAWGAEAP